MLVSLKAQILLSFIMFLFLLFIIVPMPIIVKICFAILVIIANFLFMKSKFSKYIFVTDKINLLLNEENLSLIHVSVDSKKIENNDQVLISFNKFIALFSRELYGVAKQLSLVEQGTFFFKRLFNDVEYAAEKNNDSCQQIAHAEKEMELAISSIVNATLLINDKSKITLDRTAEGVGLITATKDFSNNISDDIAKLNQEISMLTENAKQVGMVTQLSERYPIRLIY